MTFAGSPDRVESRLVPEAGFELDTFEISGFPRKPSLELCARSRARREGAVRLPGDPAGSAGPMSFSVAVATWPGRWSSRRV